MIETRLLDIPFLEYTAALELMRGLARVRSQENIPETLILVEHEPVLTMGRRSEDSDLKAAPEMLDGMGIQVHRIERGGLITYHGPGQLVAYPVMRLRNLKLGVVEFVRKLEEITIATLADYGIQSGVVDGHPGVWIGPDKIASIGLAVRRSVTLHGLALNYDPDLSHFQLINPCGLTETAIVSMRSLLGREIDQAELRRGMAGHFATRLNLDVQPWSLEEAWTLLARYAEDAA